MTHGWSLDSDEWSYAKKELAQRHRLIVWDLPGLGRSTSPTDNDWSLERLAGHLDAVVDTAGFKPVILLGHSIGGMIILTYCRLFPEKVRAQVSGLVLAHTTYTNPVKTTAMAGLMTALQKPLLEPLCHLMIWLSPLARLMNWLSYGNGSAHRSTERSSFSGRESRGQLEFLTRYMLSASPAVVARGFLAMLRYDATGVLPHVPVPTLVVAGDQDTTCKPEASVFIARSIPGARLETLASSRHCGLFEHHQEFHALLNGFVASVNEHRASQPSVELKIPV
jgi:pimeloyl-ACP methyl ester carboxylesterase